jgi:antitoxin component of MazEF toxin-antitoxin module
MQTNIKRIGNSMGVILPAYILKQFGLKVASQIEVKVVGKSITLIPIQEEKIDSLRALFKGYKGNYQPKIELDDQPKGNEEW